MLTLDDPTASTKSGAFADFLSLFAACPNMRNEAELLDALAYLVIVVPLVEAQSLRTLLSRRRWI